MRRGRAIGGLVRKDRWGSEIAVGVKVLRMQDIVSRCVQCKAHRLEETLQCR